MSPETRGALETFAKDVQWRSAGNIGDQTRLHDFIVAAFKNGEYDITQDEFLDVVHAFDTERSDEMADFAQKRKSISYKLYTYQKYEEGIKLLRHFTGA